MTGKGNYGLMTGHIRLGQVETNLLRMYDAKDYGRPMKPKKHSPCLTLRASTILRVLLQRA